LKSSLSLNSIAESGKTPALERTEGDKADAKEANKDEQKAT
jgi:hypothetical protein